MLFLPSSSLETTFLATPSILVPPMAAPAKQEVLGTLFLQPLPIAADFFLHFLRDRLPPPALVPFFEGLFIRGGGRNCIAHPQEKGERQKGRGGKDLSLRQKKSLLPFSLFFSRPFSCFRREAISNSLFPGKGRGSPPLLFPPLPFVRSCVLCSGQYPLPPLFLPLPQTHTAVKVPHSSIFEARQSLPPPSFRPLLNWQYLGSLSLSLSLLQAPLPPTTAQRNGQETTGVSKQTEIFFFSSFLFSPFSTLCRAQKAERGRKGEGEESHFKIKRKGKWGNGERGKGRKNKGHDTISQPSGPNLEFNNKSLGANFFCTR